MLTRVPFSFESVKLEGEQAITHFSLPFNERGKYSVPQTIVKQSKFIADLHLFLSYNFC